MRGAGTIRTAIRVAGHITTALARSARQEARWWGDARQARREYIGGLSNEEIDRRLRARE